MDITIRLAEQSRTVIHTKADLENLAPETVLMDSDKEIWEVKDYLRAERTTKRALYVYGLPAVVVATGEEVRDMLKTLGVA